MSPKKLKSIVNDGILLSTILLIGFAMVFFILGSALDLLTQLYIKYSGLEPFYIGGYPNQFTFQYILPDKNQQLDNGRYSEYNVAVDMRAKSFSAHMPIKVRVDLVFQNNSIPGYYQRFEDMYVIFEGSRNVPALHTGLGEGYYPGYVKANIATANNGLIRYSGMDFIQYEMGGQYVVYLTNARPSVEQYDPRLPQRYPHVNIAPEDSTFALKNAEDAARSDNIGLGLTLVVIAFSIIAVRPVLIDYIKERPLKLDEDEKLDDDFEE